MLTNLFNYRRSTQATSERKLLKELLLPVRNQKLCLIMTTGGGRGTPNNLVDQFRSNCETFCNMVIFNIPQSTQSEDVACCVKGKFSKATFIQPRLENLSSKTSSLKTINYDLFFWFRNIWLDPLHKMLGLSILPLPKNTQLGRAAG